MQVSAAPSSSRCLSGLSLSSSASNCDTRSEPRLTTRCLTNSSVVSWSLSSKKTTLALAMSALLTWRPLRGKPSKMLWQLWETLSLMIQGRMESQIHLLKRLQKVLGLKAAHRDQAPPPILLIHNSMVSFMIKLMSSQRLSTYEMSVSDSCRVSLRN